MGARTATPRAHAVRLDLPLSSFEPALADRHAVLRCAEAALRALDERSTPHHFDVTARDRIVAIDAAASLTEAPSAEAIERMRQSLVAAGYHFSVRAVRECAHAGCTTATTGDPARCNAIPRGWHSAAVCGKHGYRSCSGCDSVYLMTADPVAGPAAALHCLVCGTVLVEWGGRKTWTAELVARGRRS